MEVTDFTGFALRCGAGEGQVGRKLLSAWTVRRWEQLFGGGHAESRAWAVHGEVMPHAQSSSGERTMAAYGACMLTADACFA